MRRLSWRNKIGCENHLARLRQRFRGGVAKNPDRELSEALRSNVPTERKKIAHGFNRGFALPKIKKSRKGRQKHLSSLTVESTLSPSHKWLGYFRLGKFPD